jgi:hypothetical protein
VKECVVPHVIQPPPLQRIELPFHLRIFFTGGLDGITK